MQNVSHVYYAIIPYILSLGTAPSPSSSTPPPAFDEISDGSSYHQRHSEDRGSDRRVQIGGSIRSTSYREDTVRFV